MRGMISILFQDKSYGFIKANNIDFFFHRDDFLGDFQTLFDAINSGNSPIEVEFEGIENHPKGPRARNVRIV